MAMTFEEILDQAIAMLQRRGRLTYRTLQRQLQLDDAALDDLKDELIYGQRLATEEDGRVLVWTGGTAVPPLTTPPTPQAGPLPASVDMHPTQLLPPRAAPPTPEAERRPVYCVWEDLHWTDPSTLEVLTLFLEQVPSTRVLAVQHFRKALALLQTLPDTPERPQQELALLLSVGAPLIMTRGYATPDVGNTYARARELCQQIGETPQLFLALAGLLKFYLTRAEVQTAHELAEQLLRLSQQVQDPMLVMTAHVAIGVTWFYRGALVAARTHLEQALTLYDPHQHGFLARLHGDDPGTNSLSFLSWTLWRLGYPDQALHRSQEALTLAHTLAHPYAIAFALGLAPALHQYRGEVQRAQELAEALIRLASDQAMTLSVAQGTIMQGVALVRRGESLEEGVAQIRQGLSIMRAVGHQNAQPTYLAFLAEAYRRMAQAEEGLTVVAEALATVRRTGECHYEAELYRLQGELTLQSQGPGRQSTVAAEAEQCLHQAIAVAQTQQAKSWELRAATSLARLWHRQGKKDPARQLLGDIYAWFTEGFDTHDLREAKALLEELH